LSVEEALESLRQAPVVDVKDEMVYGGYPTAGQSGTGTDPVFVGRIRQWLDSEAGLNLWVVSDNVRKGAALNSVQIAEILVKDYL